MSGTSLTVRYEPRGAAAQLFRTRDSEVVIAGAAGTGKSLACLYRLHFAALGRPGIQCLIVRKTAVSLSSTTLVTFRKKVAAEAIATGVMRWYGGSAQEAAGYKYDNGSVINVGGMDKPDKILSSEYDLVFCDEATELTVTDWETIGTRLRSGVLPWQQQIAACNPGPPSHWLKQRADAGKAVMLTSVHRDNPAFVNADGTLTPAGVDYMSKLNNLTGVRRLRLKEGLWAAAEGLIYEEWRNEVHVLPTFDIPQEWPRWWSVDFGFTNPFVLQCWARDPDGRLYLYREIYRTKRLVEDHARDILRAVRRCAQCCESKERSHDCHACGTCRLEWIEPRPRGVICDHNAEDRATLERHLGMGTTAAKKTVSDGIQHVQMRLKTAGDGKPRLFILADTLISRDAALDDSKKPASTLEEITGYVWDSKDGKPPKESPVKEDDHGCDALRYMVAGLDLGGVPRLRRL
jgi:phage terminase large subunit